MHVSAGSCEYLAVVFLHDYNYSVITWSTSVSVGICGLCT